jgi:hypothetical protein
MTKKKAGLSLVTPDTLRKLSKQLQRKGDPMWHAQHVVQPKTDEQTAKLARLHAFGLDDLPPEVGYISRIMVLCTLPHSDQKTGINEVFTRTNGNITLHIQPGANKSLPYGIYPRLIMAYLTQEVARTKQRQISLGRSLSAFMHEIGITPSWGSKGTVKAMREQMERLFGARIWLKYGTDKHTKTQIASVAQRYELWWDPTDKSALAQDDLFESSVTLSEELFSEMLAHPIPFDKHLLKQIKDSALAVDLYWWLGMKVAYLKEPLYLSWEQLAAQLGADYSNRDEFSRKVKKQLALIALAWPSLRYETPRGRLKLYPQPTHVPKRLKE